MKFNKNKSKKKALIKIVFLTVFLFILLSVKVYAEDKEYSDNLLSEYTDLYGEELSETFDEALMKSGDGVSFFDDIISDFDIKDLMHNINNGDFVAEPKEIINALIKLLLGEVRKVSGIMGVILGIAVLESYLSGLKDGFGSTSVSECAFLVCYIVAAGMSSTAFYTAAECTATAINNISVFMKTVVPIIFAAYISCGAAISAAAMEPTLLMIIEIAVWITETVFVPAVMISTALNIVNGMSDRFKTDRMVKLLNSAVRWGLSAVLMIFVSLAGLKSIASAGADGLAIKLGKFATSNLIPVVGGILSESVETVINCGALIKNTVGIAGIICVIVIASGPVIKLAAMLLMFRITAAVAEPIADGKIVVCLSRLGDSVSVLFSILSAVTIMFVIVITVLINAGNTAVFLGR